MTQNAENADASGKGGSQHGGPHHLRLEIAGTFEAVVAARRAIHEWMKRAAATDQALNEMALVITEICNNAVEHGSATPDEPMKLTAEITDGILKMEIIEKSGEAVDPIGQALLESFGPPSLEEERGRGLFLIRVYVDEFQIDTTDANKLRIRIQKKIRP